MSYFTYPDGENFLNIDKERLKQIVEETKSIKDRKLYLIDLRRQEEIDETGLLSHDGVTALHLPMEIFEEALGYDNEEFEKNFKVAKPNKVSDILLFSCAAGGRSKKASIIAVTQGYKNVANYMGGSRDWF